MAVSQLYTAIAGDTITSARWNNEFGNIYNNGTAVAFPLTAAVSFAGLAVTNAGNITFSSGAVIDGTLQINTTDVGPHSFGSALNADVGFLITGIQATGTAMGVQVSSTTTPATGESSYGIDLIPTLTEFSAGVHALLSGLNVAPTVTAGVGTVTTLAGISTGALTAQSGTTNAAAIYINAAPTGASNNYALWVDAGNVLFDADLTVIGSLTAGSLSLTSLALSGSAPATPVAKTLYEDSITKGWVRFQIDGTILDDVNVSSITDTGVGDWTVNWATAFSTANHVVVASGQTAGDVGDLVTIGRNTELTTTAVRITAMNSSTSALADPTGTGASIHVMAIGNN